MIKTSATDVVDRYSKALGSRDFAAARAFLADNLRFEGPIDRFDSADDFMKTLSEIYGMVKGTEHQATFVEGDDVAVFYVLDTTVARAPVAEWYTLGGGKIARIRAYFDARPFARPTSTQG